MAASKTHVLRLATLDVLEAYARLRHAGLQPWLLLGAGDHPNAKRSFIGLAWTEELRVFADHVVCHYPDGSMDLLSDEPITALRRRTQATASEAEFSSGWMGVFHFGFSRHADATLAGMPATGPDAILRRVPAVITFEGASVVLRSTMPTHDWQELVAQVETAWTTPAPPLAPVHAGDWETSLNASEFADQVVRIQEWIADGDHYQSNLATRFRTQAQGDPLWLLACLRQGNPAPWMALLEHELGTLVSGSPELLLRKDAARLQSRPIAGTRKRGATPDEDERMEAELCHDVKEQAEHTMLVDLVRNDVAKVSRPGTVTVPERMSVERYRHVMHLVSLVEGQLAPGCDWLDAFLALFPGGTVTGAPKIRAIERILQCEPVPRGAYTGSVGYVTDAGDAQWNIVIRSLQLGPEGLDIHAGSGIVAGSVPAREWKEANRKAHALLDAASGTLGPGGTRLGDVSRKGAWQPTRPKRPITARVLLLDNIDSFTHNLAEAMRRLGAEVDICRNDGTPPELPGPYTHLVIGPGPGWPRDAGCTLSLLAAAHGRLPVLGVCLGHQALAEIGAGRVERHPHGPAHGIAQAMWHVNGGLMQGLPAPVVATRYHSLVLADIQAPWRVDAWLEDGTVMAVSHPEHPTFGVQFHPESLCTDVGLEILSRFLERAQ